jgi:hypothetical protein
MVSSGSTIIGALDNKNGFETTLWYKDKRAYNQHNHAKRLSMTKTQKEDEEKYNIFEFC